MSEQITVESLSVEDHIVNWNISAIFQAIDDAVEKATGRKPESHMIRMTPGPDIGIKDAEVALAYNGDDFKGTGTGGEILAQVKAYADAANKMVDFYEG